MSLTMSCDIGPPRGRPTLKRHGREAASAISGHAPQAVQLVGMAPLFQYQLQV